MKLNRLIDILTSISEKHDMSDKINIWFGQSMGDLEGPPDAEEQLEMLQILNPHITTLSENNYIIKAGRVEKEEAMQLARGLIPDENEVKKLAAKMETAHLDMIEENFKRQNPDLFKE